MELKKTSKILLLSAIIITALFAPLKVFATDSSEEVEVQPDIFELSGDSVEEMQEDFDSIANKNAKSSKDIKPYNIDFSKFIYLSDIEHDANLSYLEWKQVKKDYSSSGNNLHLLVNGKSKIFSKGIGVDSDAQVVYNIENYSADFTKLVGYIGVDYRQVNQTGLKVDGVDFSIETSNDGKTWNKVCNIGMKQAKDEAYKLDLDISNVKYIRLNALNGPNGFKSYDHALFAEIRLVQKGYNVDEETDYTGFKTLEEYDKTISSRSIEENFSNHKKEILERELVNRVGYDNLISAAKYVDGAADAFDWLKKDKDALQLFIEAGGYFSGNGYNAVVALGRLYKKHSKDMTNPVYKKLLLATAAAFCKDIRSFTVNYGGNSFKNDPVVRYENFKKLYDDGQFVRQSEFESYPMELVRTVVDGQVNNDEIQWLRNYIEKKYPSNKYLNNWVRYNGYGYASYVNTGYGKSEFYDEAYKSKWDEKYDFLKYGVSYGEKNVYRIWMFMEAGAICWGLSGIGRTVNEVQGIPAIGTYQPGHEAYLLYSQNSDGKGIWKISDDISGWGKSYTRWGATTFTEHRLMLGWGQKDYNKLSTGNNTSYTLLAQDALNDYDNYLNSMFYNLIANSYKQGTSKHEDALKQSLKCYSKNLDSLYGLYQSYAVDSSTTNDEWVALAKTVALEYRYFPAPMVDLLKLIRDKITDESLQIEVDMLQYESLKLASQATAKESLQNDACKQVANELLGNAKEFATFAFDGENANTIIISDDYQQSTLQIRVSLDGGKTWETFENGQKWTNSHAIKLSKEQISKINATDDILVGLSGTSENHRIDIKDGKAISNSVYKNDDENVLVGDIGSLEYSKDDGATWNDYIGGINSEIRFTGDVNVKFRYKAHGVYLQGPEKQYTFNKDEDNEKSKYLQLKHVSLHSYSSQQSGGADHAAKNLIDGNGNTAWHTKFNSYDQKYYSVEFDQVRYINKMTYLPGGQNGRLKAGKIYASMNGEDWTLVHEFSGLQNNANLKTIDFNKNVEAKYLKIVATENYGNYAVEGKMYFSGKMISFYEDTTMSFQADIKISYSKTTLTNQDVTAKLILPDGYTSDETEYVFKENGTHIFKYTDVTGKEGTIEAKVDWIDKVAPTAKVVYSTTEATNGTVIATVQDFSEDDIEMISEGGYTHEFTKNGEFTFKFKDKAGNIGSVEAKVTWIDKDAPVLGVSFDKTDLTNGNVTATLSGLEASDTILGDGKNYHTFTENGTYEFVVKDAAGNTTKLTVTVDWIDKTKPVGTLQYSTEKWTNDDVVVTLSDLSEEVEFLDGSKGTYTFTKNGEYTFKIKDKAGNVNEYTAKVTWLDKAKPEGISLFNFVSDDNGMVSSIKLNLLDENVEIISINDDTDNKDKTIKENGIYKYKMKLVETGYEFEYIVKVDCIGMSKPELSNDSKYDNALIGSVVENNTTTDTTIDDSNSNNSNNDNTVVNDSNVDSSNNGTPTVTQNNSNQTESREVVLNSNRSTTNTSRENSTVSNQESNQTKVDNTNQKTTENQKTVKNDQVSSKNTANDPKSKSDSQSGFDLKILVPVLVGVTGLGALSIGLRFKLIKNRHKI